MQLTRSLVTGASSVAATFALALGFGYGCSSTARLEEVPPRVDAGDAPYTATPFDAEAPASDAASPCPPGDASAFAPSWNPPRDFHLGLCTDNEVGVVLSCALDTDAQNCDAALDGVSEACRSCLITPLGADASGPIVNDDGYARLNVLGCVWNATAPTNYDGGRYDGCIRAWAAREDCAAAACRGCRAKVQVHDGCLSEARLGACAAVVPTSPTCLHEYLTQGGPAVLCNPSADFMANATAYGRLFCGTGPADAGDAGPD